MKTFLITGASGGIGSAIAVELAASGRSLFLHFNQDKESIQKVQRQCEEKGATVKLIQADLSVQNGDSVLLSQISRNIDVIIHNAGMSQYGLFSDITNEEIAAVMNAHLLNPIKITRDLLPAMIQKQKGKIIVISSIWGLTGASCEVVYSAAKGGLNSFVKGLAKEVAISNVQVNGIAPGAIMTGMLADYTEDELEQLKQEIPAGTFGKPEEVAHAVSFLCSEKAAYINGQIISINGAWYC
ncbi:elongation factor P 5-aminopentanone reductase [Halalkalibacter urbisdiaboli]|uniref:elongation factor P 5-aminopentanone reductase n=1 Tax=Halalkalibacter urbisdiaboli TaxID=1960589 RepID=UPI000B43B9BE|nr:SDR family NAD(P)-dependent oxidoreductase [Halalkalibacter urbisdiaboli]